MAGPRSAPGEAVKGPTSAHTANGRTTHRGRAPADQIAEYVVIQYECWGKALWDYGPIESVYGPFHGKEEAASFLRNRCHQPCDIEELSPTLIDGRDCAPQGS